MADSPGYRSTRGRRRHGPAGRLSPTSLYQNARQRQDVLVNTNNVSSDASHIPSPGAGLRVMESRFSLHEQFATSRREFEFDDDDTASLLEPAPILDDDDNSSQETVGDDDDEALSDTERSARRLLQANDDPPDYYSLLGLRKDPPPTVAQMRAAYHKLSLAFHPDKHPQSLKTAAERHFRRLQKAYETLIEPRKRVIYDLEGEQGVQNEFKQGGAMGPGGEAERQIGVKAMEADEFRSWFMKILQERERRTIEELVGSTGTCKVFLNATRLFTTLPDRYQWKRPANASAAERQDLPEIPNSRLFPEAMQLKQSFSIPLLGLGSSLQAPSSLWNEGLWTKAEESDVDEDESFHGHLKIGPKLTVTGAVGGQLQESMAVMIDDNLPHGFPLSPVAHWYTLRSEKFQISTRINGSFPEIIGREKKGSTASVLQGADFDITTGLFPKRSLNLGLGRPFVLVNNTKPFYCYIQTQFNHSVHLKPPVLSVRVSRSLGDNHIGYIQGGSGDFPWPAFISQRFPVSGIPLWLPRGRLLPIMKVGYIWSNDGKSHRSFSLDEDDDMQDIDLGNNIDDEDLNKLKRSLFSRESWHIAADSSPLNTAISATYGCDIFASIPEAPIRSRIRNNGEAVPITQRASFHPPRGIRLEIEADLGLHSSFGGIVRGVRRVGDFSSIGVGIGLNHQRGLYISFSWSRLGQNIILPVVLVPQDHVNLEMWLIAVAIPWASYIAAEFAIIRPWTRRKRNKLLDKKRTELKDNVRRKHEEAEQAVQLMQSLVEHRQELEREQGGLVVLNANYGVRNSKSRSSRTWRTGEVADVTMALAALVNSGQLSLPRGARKSQIIGFWDPAPLKKKTLVVEYLYAGKKHRAECVGNAGLSLPLGSHEL